MTINASCMNKTGIRLERVIKNFLDNSEQIFFLRSLPKFVGKIIFLLYYPGTFNILIVKSTCPRRPLPQSHLVVPVPCVQFFLSQTIPTGRIMPLKQNIKSRVTFSIHNYSWGFTSWHCSILIRRRNPEPHHNQTDIQVNSQSKKPTKMACPYYMNMCIKYMSLG